MTIDHASQKNDKFILVGFLRLTTKEDFWHNFIARYFDINEMGVVFLIGSCFLLNTLKTLFRLSRVLLAL